MMAQKSPTYTCLPPSTNPPQPWLLISHGNSNHGHVFYSLSEDRSYVRSIPQLRNKHICTSSHGWMVLRDLDNPHGCSLLNIVTMEEIELPHLDFEYRHCIILASPPGHLDCRVVFFESTADYSIIYSCKPGADQTFHEQDLGIDDNAFHCASVFDGKIYGITLNRHELLVLDFDGPTPEVRTIIVNQKLVLSPTTSALQCYLVEFCGEIFLVIQIFKGTHVKCTDEFSIFRSDLSQKAWVEVKSVGENCAILLTHDGCGMCYLASKESGIKGNTIYFMDTSSRSRCIYSFDLQEQSYSIYPPFHEVSRRSSSFRWITLEAS